MNKIEISKKAEKRITRFLNEAKKELEHIYKTDIRERPIEDWCYDFLINVCGYDKYSIDYQEKTCGRKAVDIAIKDEKKQILWLCECKKTSEKLSKWENELQKYCCELNAEWGVLTNGLSWRIYHFYHEGNTPKYTLVYEIKDILRIRNCKQDRKILYPFCAEAVTKRLRDKLLEEQKALSAECLGKCLLSDTVLNVLKRKIKKTEKITIDIESLKQHIQKLVPQFADIRVYNKRKTNKLSRQNNNKAPQQGEIK